MTVALLSSTIFVLAVLIFPSQANDWNHDLRLSSRVLEPVDSKFYSSDYFYSSNSESQFQRPNQYSNYHGFNAGPTFVPDRNRNSPFVGYNSDFGINSGANGNGFNTQNNHYPDLTYFGNDGFRGIRQPTYGPTGHTNSFSGFNRLPQTNPFSDPFRRTPSRFPLRNQFLSRPSTPSFQTVNQGNNQLRPIEGIFGPGKPGQFQPPTTTNFQNVQSSETSGTGVQLRPIQGIFGPGQPGQFGPQTNPDRPGPQSQLRPIKGIFGPGLPGQFDNQ